jgi:hypothetical protein
LVLVLDDTAQLDLITARIREVFLQPFLTSPQGVSVIVSSASAQIFSEVKCVFEIHQLIASQRGLFPDVFEFLVCKRHEESGYEWDD